MISTLSEAVASVEDALNAYRGSSVDWETATEYTYEPSLRSPSQHNDEPGVVLRKVQPLPHAFTAHFRDVKFKSFMGLFPEINRAWLSVDTKLFLWSYSDAPSSPSTEGIRKRTLSNDFYVYEGVEQVIVSVALVRPRPGIFVDEVKYLLVVATSVDVSLLGVTFSANGELNLVPTQISVATDDVLMLKLVGTPSGRIFMAGSDGALHELAYEPSSGSGLLDLFSHRPAKRARKVIHNTSPLAYYLLPGVVKSYFARGDELVDISIDSHRSCLYTLSQTGTLAVYDISEGVSTSFVRSVDVTHESRHLISFSVPSGEREYVSIHAVPPHSSSTVHLIVVTSFGERIYFTTLSTFALPPHASGDASGHTSQRHSASMKASTLRCVGYRPSPYRSISRSNRPCVHIAWCADGAAVFSDLRENESDKLVFLFPNTSSGIGTTLAVPGVRNRGMRCSELVFESSLGIMDDPAGSRRRPGFSLADSTSAGNGNSLNVKTPEAHEPSRTFAIVPVVEEHSFNDAEVSGAPVNPPVQFWVLSSTAMHLYERVQPVDQLKDILASGGGADSRIQSFFGQHGAAEACALCLEIAVSQPALLLPAARAFYTYGGEPLLDRHQPDSEMRNGANGTNGMVGSAAISTRRLSQELQGNSRHSATTGSFAIGRPTLQSTPLARFSGAHDGTSLYLAKILYEVWNQYITSSRDSEGYQCLSVSKEQLALVRDQVFALVRFLENYTPGEMLPSSAGEGGCKTFLSGSQYAEDAGMDQNVLGTEAQCKSDLMNDLDDQNRQGVESRMGRGMYQLRKTGEARRVEAAAIIALKDLGIRIVEGLALLMILADHQLHRLLPSIPKDIRQLLVKMRLCDIVAAEVGAVVSAALIEAIFRSYSDGTVAIASIGHVLQERCPSYFGDSDVTLHRGLTLLRKALDCVAEVEHDRLLDATGDETVYDAQTGLLEHSSGIASARTVALSLAEEAARVLKTVPDRIFDIPALCTDFSSVRAVPALVDVALTIGRVSEAEGNQIRATIAYDCILEALRLLVHDNQEDNGSGAGRRLTESGEQRTKLKDASLRVAFSAKSNTFLRSLYHFLLESKHGEEDLLSYASPSVERFLEEKEALGLLWRFCARRMRHLEAAMILLTLAEREEVTPLMNRLNYLSCAIHNAKAAASKGDTRAATLLTEVLDYMDVAKVQLRVRNELLHRHASGPEVDLALQHLDESILGLSTLFNKYARPFGLHESCLDIFRCGSYRDDAYVRILWTKIVEREAAHAHTPSMLAQKILALGREFYPSDVAFPTTFIIELLERYVYDGRRMTVWSEAVGWVSKTMTEIGVPLGDLVDAYRRMIENPQQYVNGEESWSWADEGAQLHLIKATECTIAMWAGGNQLGEGPVGGSNGFDLGKQSLLSEAETVLRAISLCKSRLRGMGDASSSAVMLRRFETLESALSGVFSGGTT